MPTFANAEELYSVLQAVFDRVKQKSSHIETFTSSNLVVRMRFVEPEAEILLDGRQPPLEVFFGPRPGSADLELTMPAELLHQIWTGEKKLTEAFFSGQIQSKGNMMRALKLVDLFREAEALYPLALSQMADRPT